MYFFVLHSANMTFFPFRKEAVKGPRVLSEDVSVNILKQKLDCVHFRALLGRDLLAEVKFTMRNIFWTWNPGNRRGILCVV